MNIYTDLPKIVFIEDLHDAGEYGAVDCPHCGALGRYVYRFRCEDGQLRGAMMGCFKKFPQTKYVQKHAALLTKSREYAAKGWQLPWWDQEILRVINALGFAEMDSGEADRRIAAAEKSRNTYHQKKYGRR